MHIEVPHVPRQLLQQTKSEPELSSRTVRERVEQARSVQLLRSKKCNARLFNRELEKVCKLSASDAELLDRAIDRFGLSSRAYHRILKVSRTIADLEEAEKIETRHLTEALSYRKLDRKSTVNNLR
jgi:magnesium chelatase family protein